MMHLSKDLSFTTLGVPIYAVEYLRHTHVNWGVVSDLIRFHCKGLIPNLEEQLHHRNTSGIAEWLDELAVKGSKTLPKQMTQPESPLTQEEGVQAAYWITLLELLAQAARRLHSQEWVCVEL